MFGLIAQLFNRYFGTPTYNILLLGIEQTGKTKTLFNAIKNIKQETPQNNTSKVYQPTVGMNFTRYSNGNDKFMIWDLGGKSQIRKIWESYYSECHGIIFIVNKKTQQSLNALKNVLIHQQMAKIPLIILVTQEDSKEKVQKQLKQADWMGDRKYVIHQIVMQNVARSKAQIKDLLHWLYFNIRQLHLTLRQ